MSVDDEEFEIVRAESLDGQRIPPKDVPKLRHTNWPFADTVPPGPEKKVQDLVANMWALVGKDRPFRTRRQIAEVTGWSESYISRVMRGENVPPVGMVAAIEEYVGYSIWPKHDPKRHCSPADKGD